MARLLDKAGDFLATVAPTIATLLGGPLAGQGVQALEKVLGLQPGSGDEAVSTALLGASPDQILALRKEDDAQKQFYSNAKIQIEKIDADDRNSARQREAAVKDNTPKLLAWTIVVASVAVAAAVITGNVAKDAAIAGMIGTVVGYLFGEMKQVTAYYFGSSQGSKDKDDTLATIAKGQ